LIEPLLPKKKRRFRYPGRKPIDDRAALTGIIFVLKTGIWWPDLPQEMGCGCGMTCWRRLARWTRAGVWQALHEVLLAKLQHANRIDWSRALIDSSSIRATRRGARTGPSPVDRRKYGSKHHIVTDQQGIVRTVALAQANRNDVTQLQPLVASIPPVRGKRGRPRRRPKALQGDRVQGDRGYDAEPHRRWLWQQGIRPVLARRRTAHGSGLGVSRWPVERTFAWLHQFRRLRIRDDILPDIHQAFLVLAAVLSNLRFLH
jgi:transposase